MRNEKTGPWEGWGGRGGVVMEGEGRGSRERGVRYREKMKKAKKKTRKKRK